MAQLYVVDNAGNIRQVVDYFFTGDLAGGWGTVPVGVLGYDGFNSPRMRINTKLITNVGTAVGSGVSIAAWTPQSGFKFRLLGAAARGSIAGRYRLLDSAAVIANTYLAANTWTPLFSMPPNGYVSTAANNVLNFQNQSGAASDMDIVVWGNEEAF